MTKLKCTKAAVALAAASLLGSGLVLTGLAPTATAVASTGVGGSAQAAAAVPGPVGNLRVVPRTGAGVDLYFDRPQETGGEVIRSYRIEVRDIDGLLVSATDFVPFDRLATSVFGLPTGEPLDVSVAARNSQGVGEAVTARTFVPSWPPYVGEVSVVPGDQSVTVRWTVSEPSGPDIEVTGFRIRGGPDGEIEVPASARSKTITGLRNGQSYRFRVTPLSTGGPGAPSDSSKVVPAGRPGLPRDVRAVAQGRTIVVRWSPATKTNGSLIKNYRVAVAGRTVTVGSKGLFVKIRNVRPGTYRATVRAINGYGIGKAASTNSVRVRR